jgi:hypothetical protein
MKKYIQIGVFTLMILFVNSSCKDFLDVVPDNVATIDNAFSMRSQAEKYLFTCYSYMPHDGDLAADPAMLAGDEIWRIEQNVSGFVNVARGFQNVVNPYGDNWTKLYQGLRNCNIFLENINMVPDMEDAERIRWIAEVKFLKAYYHFYLVRMYGPIPMMKVNLPVDADVNSVKMYRDPVDSCFNYITKLIDESAPELPLTLDNPLLELGRITRPIALSLKAEVLVTAASPLFNGNADQAMLKNNNGVQLFNQTFSKAKWDSAAIACKKAIDICHQAGFELYYYKQDFQQFNLTDSITTQLSIRNSVCKRWNSEIIWANRQSNISGGLQNLAMPYVDPMFSNNFSVRGELSPPLKIAEMYYSKNGVPINEDKSWDYANRYALRIAGMNDKLYVRNGYTTAKLNFDREPRYYADLGFDGGVWYGQGKYDDKDYLGLWFLEAKHGQINGNTFDRGTVTGYFIKKLIHYQNVIGTTPTVSVSTYFWPLKRLSDLYLQYAEALNESEGPGAEVYKYIDIVRQRAGLPGVESAWRDYSTNPSKYTTQNGFRDIIHQEQLIELAFESNRFWDLRRWKEASKVLNAPIQGWDGNQSLAVNYYRPVTYFNQTFGIKDYFWPIKEANIELNRNLVQNLGW